MRRRSPTRCCGQRPTSGSSRRAAKRCASRASRSTRCFRCRCPTAAASVETLSRSEAVQLFIDRAQLQKPGFALTEREAPAVAELCARLEGIPLALELAAARMRSLSIQEINKRLHDRFKLLTGGGRVLLERQQTLRALVAWSYDLLTENEQMLLERLGVFAGGFDLEAAEEVCGADPLTPEDVLDLADVARREVAGHGRRRRRRLALSACWRRSAIRPRVAGQARRRGRDARRGTATTFSCWRRPRTRACRVPSRRSGPGASKSSSTTCAPPSTSPSKAGRIRSSRSSSKSR